MKKTIFTMLLLVSIFLFAGCSGKAMDLEDIQTNTIMIMKDGTVSSATIEEFNKAYYSEEELKVFSQAEIGHFNKNNKEDDYVIMDALQVKEGMASMILSYKNMEQYALINHVETEDFTMEEAKSSGKMPVDFIEASTGNTIPWEEFSSNDKLRVLVVSEELDIVVSGKIQYYTGAAFLNENSVHSDGKQESVIIYKP